ncbi:unnamed protein product [Spirodela intermedia]|uniref:Uncharacterized protein n=1 Tax=Spirodela intermedia TaxID=51605 RepID=A0A7I8IWJ8_SPIIN|nr:unnamed protein product [Spirodela intermedia]CAA6662141.1 unnamed protein product [Spirodela intermedia]
MTVIGHLLRPSNSWPGRVPPSDQSMQTTCRRN